MWCNVVTSRGFQPTAVKTIPLTEPYTPSNPTNDPDFVYRLLPRIETSPQRNRHIGPPFHLLEKGAAKVPQPNTEIGSTTEPLIDPAADPSTKNHHETHHTTHHPTQPTGTSFNRDPKIFVSERALSPTSSKVRPLSLFTDKKLMFIPPMIEPPKIKPPMITNHSNTSAPKVIKLRVASVMHLVCAVVLATGAILQIFLIFKHHRNKISSFVMMLYDSFTKLFFVIILLVAVHYTPRDRVTCTVLAWLEMTCVGCICLSTSLLTFHKLIMIKFPLTNHRWTSVKDQVKVCVTGTLAILTCGTWIYWRKFELEVERGICEYQGRSYIVSVIIWMVVVHGVTTIASVVMLLYIAHLVMVYRRSKLSQKAAEIIVEKLSTEPVDVVESAGQNDTEGMEAVSSNSPEYGVERAIRLMIVSSCIEGGAEQVHEEPAGFFSPTDERAEFPTHLIFLIFLTIWIGIPWVPGMINPMWFYSNDVLDVIYSTMLFLVAASPYVSMFNRLSLRQHFPSTDSLSVIISCVPTSDGA